MNLFVPKNVFFEPGSLEYSRGKDILRRVKELGIPIQMTPSHNRVTGLPGKTPKEKYVVAKQTLVVGVRRSLKFASCKPSAHYQLPLVTSCPGLCEYCYLQTTLGPRPIIRTYVNLEEILDKAKQHIAESIPQTTIFEGAAVSDPIPIEHITGLLRSTIEFFGQQKHGRFRFVTKFEHIDSLLDAAHNRHTEARFSLNTNHVISQFEKGTSSMEERIAAAQKMHDAKYKTGFLIAPIITYETWKDDYLELIKRLGAVLPKTTETAFELISHRFTKRAKNQILEKNPNSTLPLDEESRQYKFGQFGYGKYVYPKETMTELEEFFRENISAQFPNATISYFV